MIIVIALALILFLALVDRYGVDSRPGFDPARAPARTDRTPASDVDAISIAERVDRDRGRSPRPLA